MKSLLAGIVLVGLIAASFPAWPQDSISPEIDISPLASGKNFASPCFATAHEDHTLTEPGVIGIPLHLLDQNSGPLPKTTGRC